MTDASRSNPRRAFMQQIALGSLALIPVGALACGKKLVCTDVAGLTPDEQEQRRTLRYTEPTPQPAKRCDNCASFKPAAPDECGGCTEVKGPISPTGYCNVWRAK